MGKLLCKIKNKNKSKYIFGWDGSAGKNFEKEEFFKTRTPVAPVRHLVLVGIMAE